MLSQNKNKKDRGNASETSTRTIRAKNNFTPTSHFFVPFFLSKKAYAKRKPTRINSSMGPASTEEVYKKLPERKTIKANKLLLATPTF
jgi:hypothetical protein